MNPANLEILYAIRNADSVSNGSSTIRPTCALIGVIAIRRLVRLYAAKLAVHSLTDDDDFD
jgi:hypothetical protein